MATLVLSTLFSIIIAANNDLAQAKSADATKLTCQFDSYCLYDLEHMVLNEDGLSPQSLQTPAQAMSPTFTSTDLCLRFDQDIRSDHDDFFAVFARNPGSEEVTIIKIIEAGSYPRSRWHTDFYLKPSLLRLNEQGSGEYQLWIMMESNTTKMTFPSFEVSDGYCPDSDYLIMVDSDVLPCWQMVSLFAVCVLMVMFSFHVIRWYRAQRQRQYDNLQYDNLAWTMLK